MIVSRLFVLCFIHIRINRFLFLWPACGFYDAFFYQFIARSEGPFPPFTTTQAESFFTLLYKSIREDHDGFLNV